MLFFFSSTLSVIYFFSLTLCGRDKGNPEWMDIIDMSTANQDHNALDSWEWQMPPRIRSER